MMELAEFFAQLWIARWAVLKGLGITVLISLLAILLGSLLGIGVGLVLTYGGRVSRLVARIFVDYVRGTPVFVLVLASFYLLTEVGVHLTAFQAGLFALTVFCSTHVGENARGALMSLPRGQMRSRQGYRPDFSTDLHLCAGTPGPAPGAADLGQYRDGDRESVDAAIGDRRGGVAADGEGDHRTQLPELWNSICSPACSSS